MEARLGRWIEKAVDGKTVLSGGARITGPQGSVFAGAGGLEADTPFFIASCTKLLTAALSFRLAEAGTLSLDGRLADLIDPALLHGLHTLKGVDRAAEITLRHLLSHQSGLPDYFQGRGPDERTLLAKLSAGEDQGWTGPEAVAMSKAMRPHFPPGAGRRALYSDTNYQLLGLALEAASGLPYSALIERELFAPLGLRQTALSPGPPGAPAPLPFYSKGRPLAIPAAMASFGPDGGVVSTVDEATQLLQAFFEGALFDPAFLEGAQRWRPLFFPLEYGEGLMRYRLPRLMTGFRAMPALIGHAGLSGSFMFFAPQTQTYLVGTLNQIDRPGRTFQLLTRLALLRP